MPPLRASRAFLWGLALLAAAGVAWWQWPRAADAPAPRAEPALPASEFQGVRVMDQDADGTQWTLRAERGVGWESKGTGKLEAVSVDFERGGRKVAVSARSGEITEAQTVSLSGGVKVACEGFTATLEQATYHRGKGLIRSDGAVEVEGRDLNVKGRGLELDVDGQTVRVLAQVRAVVGGKKK